MKALQSKLVKLAGFIADRDEVKFVRCNDGRSIEATIYWTPETGFEVLAETSRFGAFCPATLYEPAEQDIIPIDSFHLVTRKVAAVEQLFQDEGFSLC